MYSLSAIGHQLNVVVDCVLEISMWNEWITINLCSATCGSDGVLTRFRDCSAQPGCPSSTTSDLVFEEVETIPCNRRPCFGK